MTNGVTLRNCLLTALATIKRPKSWAYRFIPVRDWAKAYRTGRFGLALSRNQMRHSEEDHEKVIEMRAQGISWRAIQARTGISASTCRKWVMKRQSEK